MCPYSLTFSSSWHCLCIKAYRIEFTALKTHSNRITKKKTTSQIITQRLSTMGKVQPEKCFPAFIFPFHVKTATLVVWVYNQLSNNGNQAIYLSSLTLPLRVKRRNFCSSFCIIAHRQLAYPTSIAIYLNFSHTILHRVERRTMRCDDEKWNEKKNPSFSHQHQPQWENTTLSWWDLIFLCCYFRTLSFYVYAKCTCGYFRGKKLRDFVGMPHISTCFTDFIFCELCVFFSNEIDVHMQYMRHTMKWKTSRFTKVTFETELSSTPSCSYAWEKTIFMVQLSSNCFKFDSRQFFILTILHAFSSSGWEFKESTKNAIWIIMNHVMRAYLIELSNLSKNFNKRWTIAIKT